MAGDGDQGAAAAEDRFSLPPSITAMVLARDAIRDHYRRLLEATHASDRLQFRFDGNLLGDLGEAIAVELFGITLVPRGTAGVDGHTDDGRTVQVKVTASGGGPAFRQTEAKADHLLFLDLDLEADQPTGSVVFNGPQAIALDLLPDEFTSQRSLNARQIRKAAAAVPADMKLPFKRRPAS